LVQFRNLSDEDVQIQFKHRRTMAGISQLPYIVVFDLNIFRLKE
jgi:hypothetical protein